MTQAFKVGDRVRVVKPAEPGHFTEYLPRPLLGAEMRVTAVSVRGLFLGFGQDGKAPWHKGRFVKVSSAFDPQPGDRIKNMKTGREGRVLNGPISREPKVYDVKPPYRDAVPLAALVEYEDHFPGTYEVIVRGGPW